mgnify:CR=1 FL=1
MAEQPKQPRKPQRNKTKKITLNNSKHWKDIIKEIVNNAEKKEVPINLLQEIDIRLIDGTVISLDIKLLMSDGMDPEDIELFLSDKFNELDAYIDNVEFFIDIAKVVDTIQPETDKVLKNL